MSSTAAPRRVKHHPKQSRSQDTSIPGENCKLTTLKTKQLSASDAPRFHRWNTHITFSILNMARLLFSLYVTFCIALFTLDWTGLWKVSDAVGRWRTHGYGYHQFTWLSPPTAGIPNAFRPDVLRAYPPADSHTDAITACAWAHTEALEYLDSWAKAWPGPMSLVLITSYKPNTSEYKSTFRRINSLRFPKLSVHLLYSPAPVSLQTHNSHLNLARIHAKTSHVIIFPMSLGLGYLPDPVLYDKLIQSISPKPKPHSAPLIIRSSFSTQDFFNPTAYGNTTLPFPRDSALYIQRDDPLWCTERFFVSTFSSNDDTLATLEWTECLWQVWITYRRAFQVSSTLKSLPSLLKPEISGKPITWAATSEPRLSNHHPSKRGDQSGQESGRSSQNSLHARIHARMSTSFRAETCMLLARQYIALGLDPSHLAPDLSTTPLSLHHKSKRPISHHRRSHPDSYNDQAQVLRGPSSKPGFHAAKDASMAKWGEKMVGSGEKPQKMMKYGGNDAELEADAAHLKQLCSEVLRTRGHEVLSA